MKSLNLAVVVSSVMLVASSAAFAEAVSNKNLSNQQFTGQRPYMVAPVQDSTYSADDKWEGATLVTGVDADEAVANKGHAKHQQIRLNYLAKRAF